MDDTGTGTRLPRSTSVNVSRRALMRSAAATLAVTAVAGIARPAFAQRVVDLVDRAVLAVRRRQQLLHVVDVEVADAPVPDATVGDELLERLDGLAQRVLPAPMQQVEIEMLQTQA